MVLHELTVLYLHVGWVGMGTWYSGGCSRPVGGGGHAEAEAGAVQCS